MAGTAPNYLSRWFDAHLPIQMDWNPTQYAQAQETRLLQYIGMFYEASQFKHRLGVDATREELANDKWLTRRLKMNYLLFIIQWSDGITAEYINENIEENEEQNLQSAAKLVLPTWRADHKTLMETELRIIATTTTKLGLNRVGNSYCNRLLNELLLVDNAFKRAKVKYDSKIAEKESE